MEPQVVRVMRAFKQELFLREQAQMQEMARRWLDVEDALEAQVSALAEQLSRDTANGRKSPQWAIYRLSRYQKLMALLQRELDDYAGYAGDLIGRQQREWMRLGIQHASTAIDASFAGVGTFFDVLPIEAVEMMVGLAGDGSPLNQLLAQAFPDAVEGITKALINGTALGHNPRKTAREAIKAGAKGLNRMLTIARTEQLRGYRETSRQQYKKSGVVEGFYRLCAHDDRVCPACLMAEGQYYDVGEPLDEHPNGRCTTVPKVIGVGGPQWVKGADWFAAQDEDVQRNILGKGRYQAWKAGKFDLDQLVKVRKNKTWGNSVTPTPLKDLI